MEAGEGETSGEVGAETVGNHGPQLVGGARVGSGPGAERAVVDAALALAEKLRGPPDLRETLSSKV